MSSGSQSDIDVFQALARCRTEPELRAAANQLAQRIIDVHGELDELKAERQAHLDQIEDLTRRDAEQGTAIAQLEQRLHDDARLRSELLATKEQAAELQTAVDEHRAIGLEIERQRRDLAMAIMEIREFGQKAIGLANRLQSQVVGD